ncbi:MATE family efflux transporter [Priestia sp. 179-F W1.4 NHS]|uniref:MATE family efflux transporter n=1 Tax=Priestia sp. 179-F W1.4 NHS TaxID=3374296 RepID=UPI00387A6295
MQQTKTVSQKLKQFFGLFIPIFVTQTSLFAMQFFNTTMAGHVSSKDLAGVAIGASIWTAISTGLAGILLAVTPTVSQYVGARKRSNVAPFIVQAVYLAITLGLIIIGLGAISIPFILDSMNLEAEVYDVAYKFLVMISIGVIPLFIYTVLRCFMDALGQTKITMMITLCSIPINLFLNYCLMFGNLGFPKLGGYGAAISSSLTYWCMLAISILVISKIPRFAVYKVFKKFLPFHFRTWKQILKIGIPIGFSIFFESSVFSAVTILMSQFDTNTIAAHQIANNFQALLYMTPYSIALALTISVGFEAGAKRFKEARTYSFIGIGAALIFAVLYITVIIIWNHSIVSIYTSDTNIKKVAEGFLLFAALFQLSDAIATPVQGALRGYKDVNISFISTLLAYWGIGLPLGYILANYTSTGASGYWIGLISGLACAAIFLLWRLFYLQRLHFNTVKEKNLYLEEQL